MWKLIALLGVLQGLDCLTTWIAGIEREGNSFAVQVWENQGFGTIVLAKMATVLALALSWYLTLKLNSLSSMPKLVRVLWALQLCGFVTVMALTVSWNFFALYNTWF